MTFLIIVEVDESVAGWLPRELVRHNLQRKYESGSGSNDTDEKTKKQTFHNYRTERFERYLSRIVRLG